MNIPILADELRLIPFSPPFIDEDVKAEVMDVLTSGWITTGPKVKELELLLSKFTNSEKVICVNSWTSGASLVLKWLGIGIGDEVIIPAYTYAATALCVLNTGATPVMVDIDDDFTIDPLKIKKAITPATKAIISVDFGGFPCNYDTIKNIVTDKEVKKLFNPSNNIQATFGRIIIISDAAHSLGALYNNLPATNAADIAIISLHAVKNITTAEGGVICLNFPQPFNNIEIYNWMKVNSMNGRVKDATKKHASDSWRYDIISQGMKINMPDICAAIGVAQLKKYSVEILSGRKAIYEDYVTYLQDKAWALIPQAIDDKRVSSFHLFPLRIKGINENQRNEIMYRLKKYGIATNVHYLPLPMLTLFKKLGYKMKHYPVTLAKYVNEISLPIYPQLTTENVAYIVKHIDLIYKEIIL